jgi:hypothetical protein
MTQARNADPHRDSTAQAPETLTEGGSAPEGGVERETNAARDRDEAREAALEHGGGQATSVPKPDDATAERERRTHVDRRERG